MLTNHGSFFKRSSLVLGLTATVLFTGNVFADNGKKDLSACGSLPICVPVLTTDLIVANVLPLMLATAEAMGKAGMSKSDVGAYLEKVFRSLADSGFIKIESTETGFEMTLEWDGGSLTLQRSVLQFKRCVPPYGCPGDVIYALLFRGDGHEFEHECFDGKRKKFELPIPFYNPHFC